MDASKRMFYNKVDRFRNRDGESCQVRLKLRLDNNVPPFTRFAPGLLSLKSTT